MSFHEAPATVALVIAYDGTDFRGFAAQGDDVRTVAGELNRVLSKVTRRKVEVACAGRTDAGVHAWGQVVSFAARTSADLTRIVRALNGMLGPEIVVRDAWIAADGFDARHSATGRRYRYTVLNTPSADPFLARYAWHVPDALDLAVMRLAADVVIGEHDFASFCRKGPAGSTTKRMVRESHWTDLGNGILRYEVEATAFCWQMVRSLVGTLVETGLGKKRPGDMLSILRARSRAAAGNPAPPHGLCLHEVTYD
ncbi:MAG: tRNA pseudouridine(38-40) synthase TruA [Acidimicrobiia bacterium]